MLFVDKSAEDGNSDLSEFLSLYTDAARAEQVL